MYTGYARHAIFSNFICIKIRDNKPPSVQGAFAKETLDCVNKSLNERLLTFTAAAKMSPNRRETNLSNPLLSMSDDESDIEDMILSRATKKTKKKKIATIIIILIVFLAFLGGIIYYFFSKKTGIVSTIEQQVELEVQGGAVRGQFDSGVVAFKGIPYAKPPVKELR